jgi:hypothetical protein
MNDEIERLLQDEADGVATPEQLGRLRELLAANPGARERRREIEAVFRALERVENVEAPDLRYSVLSAIGRDGQAPAPRPSWITGMRAAFGRRPGVALAYAFGAGAVASALAIAHASGALTRWAPGVAVTGTMAPPDAGPVRREVTVAGEPVVFEVVRRGGSVEVLVATGAALDARVTLEFDPRAFQVVGLRWGQPGPGAAAVGPGRIVLEPRAADCRLELAAGGPPSPIQAVVERAGDSARTTLAPPDAEEDR